MRLSGWGGYPTQDCQLYRPESIQELNQLVREAPSQHLISRGMGRSYGDASLNEDEAVVLHERLNRFLEFDAETGVLRCESAVTLSEIIDTLLPLGFFPSITPGTKHISVGGAIAADVHGKNHHRDGTISSQILDFRLLTSEGKILKCSRSENQEVFWATLGGMGLTGAILDARLRLRPVETAYVKVDTQRCRDLDQTLAELMERDHEYEYAVAWLDGLAQGRSLGRSVLLRSNTASLSELSDDICAAPLRAERSGGLNIPFRMPNSLINRFSMRLFNSAYYRTHRTAQSLVHCQRYFYPLDAIGNWSRLYGRRGVLQYQLVLPRENCHRGVVDIMERVAESRGASFLAVLKSTGPSNAGPLSFPVEGVSLALDFPNRGAPLRKFLAELDKVVLGYGGRTYLAKDSTLSPESFRQMYPRFPEFMEVKRSVDPRGRFSSSLARRLQILE